MTEPITWAEDGTPRSPRYGDIYHPRSGALMQARHVFIDGAGLPAAWRGEPCWTVVETGFGLGLNLLATWATWRADPQRCARLHLVSVEAHPVGRADLARALQAEPELAGLAAELLAQYPDEPGPGAHRLVFDGGRVTLTLWIGEALATARQWRLRADTFFLDGFSPARNPAMWEPQLFKALARCGRPGSVAVSWTVASAVRKALGAAGFSVQTRPGLTPGREVLRAVLDAPWATATGPDATAAAWGSDPVLVIGAGLSGAALVNALARRGVASLLIDAGAGPAAGASGLPCGVLAEHRTRQPTALSRLTALGVRHTLSELRRLLPAQEGWRACAIETRSDGVTDHLSDGALVHPTRLIDAWLDEARSAGLLDTRWNAAVARLQRSDDGRWQALDAQDRPLARASHVLLAGAFGSAALLAPMGVKLPVSALKGQLSLAPLATDDSDTARQRTPLRGDGMWMPWLLHDGQPHEAAGATYERGVLDLGPTEAAHDANLAALARLDAAAGARFAAARSAGTLRAWTGLRCASHDRLPLAGPVADETAALDTRGQPVHGGTRLGEVPRLAGLHLLAGMGSRGLSLAALCAETLVARALGEPLLLEATLADGLDPGRTWLRRLRQGPLGTGLQEPAQWATGSDGP